MYQNGSNEKLFGYDHVDDEKHSGKYINDTSDCRQGQGPGKLDKLFLCISKCVGRLNAIYCHSNKRADTCNDHVLILQHSPNNLRKRHILLGTVLS